MHKLILNVFFIISMVCFKLYGMEDGSIPRFRTILPKPNNLPVLSPQVITKRKSQLHCQSELITQNLLRLSFPKKKFLALHLLAKRYQKKIINT